MDTIIEVEIKIFISSENLRHKKVARALLSHVSVLIGIFKRKIISTQQTSKSVVAKWSETIIKIVLSQFSFQAPNSQLILVNTDIKGKSLNLQNYLRTLISSVVWWKLLLEQPERPKSE